MTEIFGILGAIFFSICAIPQVYQTYKTQNTKDLNFLFLLFWSLGEVFMWTYVILQNIQTSQFQYPLHINYLVNAFCLAYLVYKKLKEKR